MDTNSILVFILGVVVRLGLPVLVTTVIVIGLRRLDVRWQKEAEIERNLLVRDETPCWKEQGLSLDEIKARAAESGKPCWQIHRLSNGYMREACLDCQIFINAPVPVLKPSKAHA